MKGISRYFDLVKKIVSRVHRFSARNNYLKMNIAYKIEINESRIQIHPANRHTKLENAMCGYDFTDAKIGL